MHAFATLPPPTACQRPQRVRLQPLAALCLALVLSGCSQLSSVKWPWASDSTSTPRRSSERPRNPPAASPTDTKPATSADAYAEGMSLYRSGEYDAAIARFSAVQSPTSLRVQALKHTAFSYCVTNRLGDCENAFRQALRLSPRFRLTPAEQGHPVWGPVFNQALRGNRSGQR